jgi:hypothetical protein
MRTERFLVAQQHNQQELYKQHTLMTVQFQGL